MLTHTALRLLRRLLAPRGPEGSPHEGGTPTLLDGATAVAVTEALISEAAGLGAGPPLQAAELAWRSEQRYPRNGPSLSGISAEGPRGALAAALGQALAGLRATAFLSGPDLAAAGDLLQAAAGQHVPLVIHLGLRGLGGPGPAPGSGHEALHRAADAGALVLVAANVQEAVDFTLIARRVAEQALLPVLVAQDGEQTALALQDLRLPAPGLLERFLGRPDDPVPAPTPAQHLLYGDTRRRLPRGHDPDRPVLLGSRLPPEVHGLAQAAAGTFFDAHAEALLGQALSDFNAAGGRPYRPLSRHRLDDAELILVAQGAAIETAEGVCERLRAQRLKVGVLGVRGLRPFPGAEAARLLGRPVRVCVLERLDTPLAGEPPLLRELRAALGRRPDDGRARPHLLSVPYGLGGLPLRAEDLAALCRAAPRLTQPRVTLGLSFATLDSPYPKRQVLLDRLRRSYPGLAELGLGRAPPADLRPAGCLTLSLHRLVGGPGDGLAVETGALLQRLLKGGLRGRPGTPMGWGRPCVDRISVAPTPLGDLGDAPPADLALLTADPRLPGLWPQELAQSAAVLILSALPDDALGAHLPAAARNALQQADAALYRLPAPAGGPVALDELLGALCGVLLAHGRLEVSRRRLLALREELLGEAAGARLERFTAGLDAVRRIAPGTLTDAAPAPREDDTAPAPLRGPGRLDSAYDSLPRFWDQVGVLYARGDTAELAPDPYLALGAVPPRSAALRDLSGARAQLPLLDPARCSGCGACWSGCPDGAWGATVLPPAQLLEAGLQAAQASALRPLAGKLGAALTERCRAPQPPATLGELLTETLAPLQASLPPARQAALQRDREALDAALGALPLAVTEPLFQAPEAQTRGHGALLALALDADACKGCGLCVTLCAPGALSLQRQDRETLAHTRRQHQAWQRLPGSDPATLARLQGQPGLDPLGAALLAPAAAAALSGGDGAEPGSGARLALRLALALAEAHQAPLQEAWRQEVQEAHRRITALIRGLLTEALPADDLDALAQGLETLGAGPADLGALLGRAEDRAGNRLDSTRLRRLVALARGLGELAGRLGAGPQGPGRARTALVLALSDGGPWGIDFPYNPFTGPAILDRTGDAPLLAAGLLDGQLRHTLEGAVLLRRARLEREQPEQAAHRGPELERLGWHDLTPVEQARAPQLLLVGDAGILAGRALSQLHRLLASGLPVKLLVLADLDLGLAVPAGLDLAAAARPDGDAELGLLALSQRGAYLAQSALGAPEHLRATLERLLAFPGPALLHLHAPSPGRHGFPSDRTLARAQAAVACRVFPLFRYDPEREGVFGSRLDLDGNPAADARTPAHWALGEGRFAALFRPLAEDAPAPLALSDYLARDPQGRRGHTPYLERAHNGEQPQRLAVDPELVRVCEARQAVWRMLQELAGTQTPFTARVQQAAEARVAAAHQAELAAQAADYEARLSGLHDQLQQATRQELRARLMELTGYPSS